VVHEAALGEILEVLRQDQDAAACVKVTGRDRQQVRATIEIARELPRAQARRIAMDNARAVGATLRRHGFAIPAYVEIFSPERWHGIASYDSDTLQITWETCPTGCERTEAAMRACQRP
jgi:hypothetical protein